ncbi:MAG: phospholipid carrier-dependent glycosyltransferase, partial [Chloroflexi bacterium]
MSAITFPREVPAQGLNVLWTRASFAGLMLVTFVLYMSGLDRNGWANAYYAAAVEAGATNWKAFFFGSLDTSNFITVDKSPAFLWVMEISARLFGFNEWSVLVPQALEGVATVGIVFVAVRRWFGPAAGLIAGAVVALTPVAALMFRYNNPDALLVLLLTAGAYATLRAVETGSTRWLLLAAALIGTGFLAKMLQAFVVIPVVVIVYLALGRPRLLQRIKQLAIAGCALVLASGWWVVVVELWPSADRPYIGGSQDNSLLNLIFGYNGVGRITGNEVGSVGGIGGIASRWGLTGWNRLFLSEFGGQISWLIPAALILMAAGLWITLRVQRADLARASYLMWGGYLLVTGAVFSFAQGIVEAAKQPCRTALPRLRAGSHSGVGVRVARQDARLESVPEGRNPRDRPRRRRDDRSRPAAGAPACGRCCGSRFGRGARGTRRVHLRHGDHRARRRHSLCRPGGANCGHRTDRCERRDGRFWTASQRRRLSRPGASRRWWRRLPERQPARGAADLAARGRGR